MLTDVLILSGFLLASIALVQALSQRFAVSEAVLLAALGFALGGMYALVRSTLPSAVSSFVAPVLSPTLPAETFLWLFLPTLLFQASLSVDVREMLNDIAPILLLAVVAVFVVAGMIGVVVALAGFRPLVDGLLLGAVIATTDPSAVLAVFREVGAPARLVRLVEGESLLNDAAAIAIVAVLLAALSGDPAAATLPAALRALAVSFVGGLLLGAASGRVIAWLLPKLGGQGKAEMSLTFALPYPLYMVADQVLHVSGVVAVVAAGMVISLLGRTRLTARHWRQVQFVWEQAASVAGAAVFLLAAIRIPHTLRDATWPDAVALLVVVLTALAARLLVIFGMLPILSALHLTRTVSHAYKLVISWGGLRGAVTLVLAMSLSENTALPAGTRQFVSILATGFVLVSLIVNGSSLRMLIRRLRLDRLSVEERAVQRQAVRVSAISVQQQVHKTAEIFHIPADVAQAVNDAYEASVELGSVPSETENEILDRERLVIGLTTLASRERDLIPQYGSGILSIRNLDAMMRNTEDMIEGVREDGRLGYKRMAAKILDYPISFRIAVWIHRYLHIDRPLAAAAADRFELMMCRRVVLGRLRIYASDSLQPLLGQRLVSLLCTVLTERIASLDQELDDMRHRFAANTAALEHRMLLLYALHEGRRSVAAMFDEQSISKEVFDSVSRELDEAWRNAVKRPPLQSLQAQNKQAAE